MKKTEKQTLVKGEFNPADAKEVLVSLFKSKINYHTTAAFSKKILTGKGSSFDIQRVEELRNSLRSINEILEEAERGSLQLIHELKNGKRFFYK
jgi:hypothetical protein